MEPLKYIVRSVGDLQSLAAALAEYIPGQVLQILPIHIRVETVGSLSGARAMESVLCECHETYGWSSDDLPSLRSLAHLEEMMSATDDHLEYMGRLAAAGRHLQLDERTAMLATLREMGFVLMHAAEGWKPASSLAHRLLRFAKIAGFSNGEFPARRIRRVVAAARGSLARVLEEEPPML